MTLSVLTVVWSTVVCSGLVHWRWGSTAVVFHVFWSGNAGVSHHRFDDWRTVPSRMVVYRRKYEGLTILSLTWSVVKSLHIMCMYHMCTKGKENFMQEVASC